MITNNNKLSLKNRIKLSYKLEKNLLYQTINNENHLCISHNLIHEILKLMHSSIHHSFDRFLQNLAELFIYKKIKLLKQFINHCLQCKLNCSRWHQSYDFLQSILSSSISFHTITLDFIKWFRIIKIIEVIFVKYDWVRFMKLSLEEIILIWDWLQVCHVNDWVNFL